MCLIQTPKHLFLQRWVLLVISFLTGLLALASTIMLSVAVVEALINKGERLLTHCDFQDEISSARITNECPFDPTRIYVCSIFTISSN